MRHSKLIMLMLCGSLGLGPMIGCESLPGNKKEQGAVIGGLGGAAVGAAVAKGNRGLGAVIGALAGAGGGYLVGANLDKHDDSSKSKQDAQAAAEKAKANPAKASEVNESKTADLNNDGFVTLDEVVAMKDAGLGDNEMIKRLERTQQYFQLTADQQKFLADHGVDQKVITAMADMKPTDANVASEKQGPTTSPSNVEMQTSPR